MRSLATTTSNRRSKKHWYGHALDPRIIARPDPLVRSFARSLVRSFARSLVRQEDKSTTEELKNLPAVFELAVVHPSRPKARVKCYIGKCMDFQKCSREILTGDNHYLTKFLRLALQHGNSVVRRYVYYVEHAAAGRGGRKAVDVECLVGKAYDRMLSFYDYPWNEQAGSGSGTRGVYAVPKTALCCVPSGVDVIRIHPTMLK